MPDRPAYTRTFLLSALALIFSANFFNYIDRQLVSALEQPLTDSFHLSKEQYGLLWTLFTLGYMLCAVPVGILADRFSRVRLLATCIVIWSVATIASGLAQTTGVLYVARLLIGVGEAGCLIVGPSLISDYFSQETRGRALSVFYMGLPLGGTMAFIAAGLFFHLGWRNLFYLAGAPGFVIALLLFFLPDPPRGTSGSTEKQGIRQYLSLFRIRSLLFIILAQAFAVIILIPLIHFGVEFFVESRGIKKDDARILIGVIALVAGLLGNTTAGIVGDRLAKRIPGAYALLAGIGYLAGWPCLLVGFLAEERTLFLAAITVGCFFLFLCMPAVNTHIANVVPAARRATAWALAVFILHLLGDTLAPWLFGRLADRMPRQQVFLYFSCAMIFSGICALLAWRTAPRITPALDSFPAPDRMSGTHPSG